MQYKILLIVQSPVGIASILQLYKNNFGKNAVTIACVGSKGLYQYLLQLNLRCHLIFIQPVAYSHNKFLYLTRLRSQKSKIKILCKEWDAVYFTSIYQDLFTLTLVNECQNNNIKVFRISTGLDNLHKYSATLGFNGKLIEIVASNLIKIIIGVNTKLVRLSGKYFFCYANSETIPTIKITVKNEIYEDFGITISGGQSRNILLFESGGEAVEYFSDYRKDLKRLVDKLSLIGVVYIKPHPTHGISSFLEGDARFKFLNQSTPAIMIKLSNFSMVVGIESAALKEIQHSNVVSVIDSFSFVKSSIKHNFKSYLLDQDSNNLKFMSIDELEFFNIWE